MSLHKAVFSGSFDPLHSGHINIIERASKLFNFLYVAVSHNVDKKSDDIKKRFLKVKKQISKLNLQNVKVVLNDGLTAKLVTKLKCQYLIRSIRDASDVKYEINMAQNNYLLNKNIETIFFVADSKLKSVSSTNEKELKRQKALISKWGKNE